MFMDGLIYADVALNVAEGKSSLWELKFTETRSPEFYGHPPLAFWIQAIFFKVFGDYFLVEKMYGLLCYLITAILLYQVHQQTAAESQKKYVFGVFLVLLMMPQFMWAVSNNMLENTLMVFTTGAVLATLMSLKKHPILYSVLAGVLLVAGFLTKGFVALFPLAVLPISAVLIRTIPLSGWLFRLGLTLLTMILLFGCLIWCFPDLLTMLLTYFDVQLMTSLTHAATVDTRFFIVVKLLEALLIPLLLLIIGYLVLRLKWNRQTDKPAWSVLFFILGLAGVLPIMVSLKQNSFYIIPALPFFALALNDWFTPIYNHIINLWRNKLIRLLRIWTVAGSIGALTLIVLVFGHSSRQHDELQDIHTLSTVVGKGSTLSIHPSLWQNWPLHGLFYRYHRISLDAPDKLNHQFYIQPLSVDTPPPQGYKPLTEVELKIFRVYELME
jgi:4-amino-4-deoxy-L-arabinose transferase-like glycosyltransferase